jgi:sortase B
VGCAEGFESPHTILYGHNAKDGGMFGSLSDLLELEGRKYPAITITLPDGSRREYSIHAVRESDGYDVAYQLGLDDAQEMETLAVEIGVPEGTSHVLTLSTCSDSGDAVKRLLIHAAFS